MIAEPGTDPRIVLARVKETIQAVAWRLHAQADPSAMAYALALVECMDALEPIEKALDDRTEEE